MEETGGLSSKQPDYQSIRIPEEIIKQKVVTNVEDEVRSRIEKGQLPVDIGNQVNEIAQAAPITLSLQIPRKYFDAKFVTIQQIESFEASNNFFDVLLSLSTCFLGTLLGYLLTSTSIDATGTLVIIVTVIFSLLTIWQFVRRKNIMDEIKKTEFIEVFNQIIKK